MRNLITRQRALQDAAWAASTRAARSSQLDCYKRFCILYSLDPFPCGSDQACLYASFLCDFMSPSSVTNYLSALWAHHRLLGLPTHQDDFRLRQTLRGIHRLGRPGRKPRHPLSLEDLHAIFLLINTYYPPDLVFWAAVSLAFRGLLRKSHYTPSSHTLHWRDLSLYPDHLVLLVPSSKTNQFGLRPHRIVLNSSPGSFICPVFWLSELARVQHPMESDVIFHLPIPGGLTPMEYSWFNDRLKHLSSLVGLSPVTVSSHSLRHGGASFMASLGSPMLDIRARGGWSSSAIYSYLNHTVGALRAQDTRVATHL